ncbi:MAG: cellulose synthase/poly-beta-1,6-N-acetylglucosamine synthase-like glycosyltransferase [Marivirga sp.]|jgi:cellulose synthase/poly-beta-1,6-N-acetylglucosamine synthase-like glycosyltransferase
MVLILTISLSLVLISIAILAVLWTAWKPKAQNTDSLSGELPKIAVLVAVRNEFNTIEETLLSLLALDYPSDKIELFIGDDGSTDGSTEIMKKHAALSEHLHYVSISQHEGASDIAKSFVLGELAKLAKSDYLMFTDGDIVVPPSWIKKHVACLKEDTSIQSGFTVINKVGFFSSMQMIDWSFALGMVKILSGWGVPVTAVGNNMLIKREAYDAVGGFEKLPFSVTEDFAIFKLLVSKGFGFQQLANQESLAVSASATSLRSLLQQRKRWMVGAMQLPLIMRGLLFVQALYYVAIIILLIFNPLVAIPLFGLKITIQSLFINKIHERIGEYIPIGHLFIFEFYSAFLTIILSVYYLLPLPVEWKGRKLNNK